MENKVYCYGLLRIVKKGLGRVIHFISYCYREMQQWDPPGRLRRRIAILMKQDFFGADL